jgi:hypothetical protein
MIKTREITCQLVCHPQIRPHTILTAFSLDGGDSGLPALRIGEETFSRLQYDLGSEEEIRPCDHCDLFMGSGLGAYVQRLDMIPGMNGFLLIHSDWM